MTIMGGFLTQNKGEHKPRPGVISVAAESKNKERSIPVISSAIRPGVLAVVAKRKFILILLLAGMFGAASVISTTIPTACTAEVHTSAFPTPAFFPVTATLPTSAVFPASGTAAATYAATGTVTPAANVPPTEYRYRVVRAYPHDPGAFTQGLAWVDGRLYEGTGREGESSLRRVDLTTGRVLQERRLDRHHFGEGITVWKDRIIQLTWRSRQGFIYDRDSFRPRGVFHYDHEGWGITHDGRRLIVSDGSPVLRFYDPETFRETGRLPVRDEYSGAVGGLNELEYVRGMIYANLWPTDIIAIIDPRTGRLRGRIDLSGLPAAATPASRSRTDVLNGIAYDPAGDRLFVTGKYWPLLFEIRIVKK